MFVGGIVVEHGMDNPASRDLALNGVEKADEFAVAVPLHAAADDGTIEHAECREQAGGAVPLIVVRHRLAAPGLDRQSGLSAVKRLDLALFVDRQHHGMGRGVDIEPDDVGELGGKAGIARALEGAQPMRLQLVQYARCAALHRTQRNADGFGNRPAGPVGCLVPRLSAGQRHRAAISDCSVEYRPHKCDNRRFADLAIHQG